MGILICREDNSEVGRGSEVGGERGRDQRNDRFCLLHTPALDQVSLILGPMEKA